MSSIRHVVFDLGGVLINYNPKKIVSESGYEGETAQRFLDAIFMDPTWTEMDRGTYMTYQEALPVFIERHPDMEKEIRAFFNPNWFDVYTVKEDSLRLLFDRVPELGADIYVISNFGADGFTYVREKYDFFDRVKGYVVSAFEKCIKPDLRIYNILFERFNLKAEECVFIDDCPCNVEAARTVGMKGIVFTDPQDVWDRLSHL